MGRAQIAFRRHGCAQVEWLPALAAFRSRVVDARSKARVANCFRLIEIVSFISNMGKVQRRDSLIVQHGFIADSFGLNLPVQLFGLFQFTLPVENLSQELNGCQHTIDILSRAQQRPCFKDFILRFQNPTRVQCFITDAEQAVAAPEHIMLREFIQ